MKKKLSILMLLAVFMALASTLAAQTTCQIKIVGEDSYGDGWNDGVLSVVQGGTTVITWAAPNTDHGSGGPFYDSTMVTVSNSPISFVWTEGDYDDEVTIWIYNANGVLLFTVNEPSLGTIFSMANPCSNCFAPSNLHLTSVSSDSASLAWAGDANGNYGILWGTVADVLAGNGTSETATTNSITFSNLTAGTGYMIMVWTDCGNNETSDTTTFIFSTIADAVNTFPYTTGFEATDDVAWTFINDATNKWYIGSATNNGGTNSLYISNDNGTTNAYTVSSTQFSYAYRPFSITDSGQYAVSFDWKANGESNYDYLRAWIAPASAISSLSAGHTPDGNNSAYNYVYPNPVTPTGWVDLGGKMNLQTSWQTLTATPSLTAGSYVLIFMWANDASSGTTPPAAVDNIVFTQLSCPQPTALTVSGITATDATLTWTAGGSETEWEMSINGGTWESVVSPVLLDTLTANTPYSIRVRAVCGYDDTSFVTAIAFRTMCTLIDSLPYTENFDGVTGATTTSVAVNNLPSCWNYHNVGTSTSYSGYPIVYNSSSYAHSGTQAMRFYTYITAGTYADQYAILPMTDSTLYPVNTLQVDFWMRSNSTSYNSWVVVGVMTNPADASSFVPVETVYTNSSTTYAHHEVLFGNYNGPHGCVAFKFSQPTSGYNYGYVDDITLDVMPTCPPIVSHHVTATAGAAQITWETNPNFGSTPDSYTVNYGYASDSLANATTVTVTDPELLLTGLTADTAYMVSIEPICTDGSVAPEVFTFTTGTLPCLEWDTTGFGGPTDTLTVGTPGTSTTNVMPINTTANYSYTQHLILASHIATTGPTNFSGIAFDYAYSQPMTHATNCQIYMGNTTRANFNVTSGSSTDSMFVPYSQLTLVYSGPLNCTTNGYNYFDFNQGAFAYDGTSNIVVAIVNNSGASNSSAIFRYEQTSGAAMSHRVFNSTTPYGPTEMDAARAGQSYWRTNMKLLTGGGTCLAQASCAAPAVDVMLDTAGDIEVSWIPGYQETAWDLDYQADGDTTWTSVLTGTTNTSHTIMVSSLLANTRYTFRVAANCSDTNIAGTANFTTPCSYISLPYNYGFEDMATGTSSARPEIPCWHHLNNGTSYYGYPYVYASAAHTGSRGLYWYLTTTTGTYGDYEVVVLPPVDPTINPANTLQLTFWAKPTSTSYAPVFLVGVMTDPTDVSTFQTVATVNVSHTSTDWGVYETSLGSYTGNGQYVAIRANRPGSSWYAYLDDVTLDLIPVCARVENVGATNITDSSATIYWDTTSSTEYDVQYGPTGFAVGSGTMVHVVDVDSLDIAGLTPNTAYDVYVRGNCPQDSGTWSFVYTFRTACVAFSVPYTEDFESYGTGSAQGISACWTKGTNSSTAYPYPYSTNAVTGSRSLYFYGYHPSSTSTTAIYSYAALPAFQEPINTLQLDFKVRTSTSTGAYYNTYLIVGVMGNPSDISTFVGVDTINLAGETAGSIHDISVSFSNYTGNGQYIAIYDPVPPLFGSTYNYSYAYVDDVTVDFLPACPRVEHLMASPMLTTATVSWEDTSSTNTSWYVEYDTVAFTPGTGHMTPIIVTDTFAVLNNLDSGTVYHVYVYPDCDTNVLYRHITFSTLAASPAGVPYFCDFETAGVNGWDFVNGTQNNYWMVGNATNNGGSRSMYITDNGTANSYSGAASYVFATRTFNLTDTGAYICAYDWKAQGESSFDFLRVALVPASTQFTAGDYCGFNNGEAPNGAMPAGGIALDGGGRLNLQSSWQTEVVEFNLTTPGTYTMVFMWRNDPSVYNQPPAAIDNVGLMRNTCPSVSNVTVSNVTGSAATVQWTAGGSETEWEVSVNGNATIVSTPTTTLTGLSSLTSYSVKVRPICSVGDTGFAVSVLFTTDMCDSPNIVATGNPDSTTTTSYYAPVNNFYNYTLSETIIDSAELGGPMDINAITYYYNYTTAMTAKTDVNIYIQPTNKTAFSATSDIVALSSDAVLVYSGPLNCTHGWNTFGFITPYAYNGSGNLMVIVDDNSGDYDASSYTFKTQSTSAYKTIVYYSDSYNPDAATISSSYSGTKAYYQYRPVMQLISCGASCANPSGLHTTSVTYNSVEVVWSGTDSAEVGIHQGLWDETGATITTVTTNSYTFTGLTPNMQYTIAVRKLCEDNMTSDWVYLTVTTDDLPCFAPTNVQVSNETPSGAKVTWTRGGNETEWVVNVFRSGVIDTNYTVINTPMCNVSGLYSAMTYTVKVGAVCGGIDTMWSETTTLTTTACLPPTNVNAVANGHQAIVTWEGTGANEYHVLWFLQGFTTDGDSVIATNGTTNATIDGLVGGEDYDIYVYAYCDGQRSAQAGQTQLHVTGIDDINTSAINLYPNPANTTVTVDGIEGEALVTIVDMNGRTVFSEKTVSSITIDLGGMAKGAYFVRITGENSSAIRKLIVK